jgi:hypothetical protein
MHPILRNADRNLLRLHGIIHHQNHCGNQVNEGRIANNMTSGRQQPRGIATFVGCLTLIDGLLPAL